MTGAMPVFADIEPDTFTISVESCERILTPRTRAIIGVHLGGRPFDADALKAFADKHDLFLLEDAAHAHGSEWRGRRTGSLGTAGSFSFQASKNLSCGEGGCVTTNDTALYKKLWSLHHNGRHFSDGSYDHPYLGTDARLAEWQCAILRARMGRIDGDINKRMDNAEYLDNQLAQFPFFLPMKKDERITRNALHVAPFRYMKAGLNGLSREIFLMALKAENVCIVDNGYSTPVYDLEFLKTDTFKKAVGRAFSPPAAEDKLNNERAAHVEGCWMYHSVFLGEKQDMNKIVEAFGRIAAQADALADIKEA
jgi:dTDP-4-amino-4,6-dideoxygalactose transaminase